ITNSHHVQSMHLKETPTPVLLENKCIDQRKNFLGSPTSPLTAISPGVKYLCTLRLAQSAATLLSELKAEGTIPTTGKCLCDEH
ncbi:jg3166, partial [Pararge aegeria aegeria]